MTALKFTKKFSRDSQLRGFTLVEMLTVMGIMAILGALIVPALQGLQKGSGFTSTVYNVSDLMNLARTYAVANDTYVYVGIEEVNRANASSVSPQTAGVGRVAICIVATNDGTSNIAATNLSLVRPVQLFDFLHVYSGTAATFTSTGNMARPDTNPTVLSGFSGNGAFKYPLGASTGKYTFSSVICYNPQGAVVSGTGSAVQWAELDLQPYTGSGGTSMTAANVSNEAALVVEGATGATTVYRP